MSTIARGVSKKIAYNKESAWGVLAPATGATYLRRVTGQFNLTKETAESQEIRTDFQVADFRHTLRSAEGSLNGELSPTSYAPFMASVVARDFTVKPAVNNLTLSAAVDPVNPKLITFTTATDNFVTSGLQVGNVIQLDATAGLPAGSKGNNLLVIAVEELTMKAVVLSNSVEFEEFTSVADIAVKYNGKTTYAPLTGHTDDSYTVEEFFSDIGQSEVYTGMKVGSMAVQLPVSGYVTTDFSFMGKNREKASQTQYFTNATDAGTNGLLTAVSGALVVNGQPVAVVTSMDFSVDRGLEAANVIGTNFAADVFTGRIRVTGNFSAYFTDTQFAEYFDKEAAISIVVALSTGDEADAEVLTFAFPRVKVGSATKNDGEMGIVQDLSFQALLNSDVTGGKANTTILIHDTSLN